MCCITHVKEDDLPPNRAYLDNASTSCPKPHGVMEAMAQFARECGVSPGRGSHALARDCERRIATCRARIARLIHAEGPERIVFAMNCSEALNLVIHGLLNAAPRRTHVLATAMTGPGDTICIC